MKGPPPIYFLIHAPPQYYWKDLMECPKCAKTEKVEYVSKKYYESGIEFQLICRNCGNLFTGHLNYDEL